MTQKWWLKAKVKEIALIIQFHCSRRVYFFGNDLSSEDMDRYIKDKIRKWFCRILFSMLTIFLILVVGFGTLQFIKFLVLFLSQGLDYLIKWLNLDLPPK